MASRYCDCMQHLEESKACKRMAGFQSLRVVDVRPSPHGR